MGRPNCTGLPNIPPDANSSLSADIERVLDGYDRMMHRLVGTHASEFTEVGITMAQAKVLYVVMAAGRLRMSELAARLGIGSSSASELADRLVELGLLERHTDTDDRRQVVVTATPDAEALLEQFRELNMRQLRDLLSRLDAAELAIVERSMGILDEAIDRAAAAATSDPSAIASPTTRPSHPRAPKSETRP